MQNRFLTACLALAALASAAAFSQGGTQNGDSLTTAANTYMTGIDDDSNPVVFRGALSGGIDGVFTVRVATAIQINLGHFSQERMNETLSRVFPREMKRIQFLNLFAQFTKEADAFTGASD